MPVSLQQFFTTANAVGNTASLFLNNNTNDVGTTSQLHGLQKLSGGAKMQENQATVRAFMAALAQTPGFQNLSTDMQSLLNTTLAAGKPLTAETVRMVRDSVSYTAALATGRDLVDSQALPEGHASSFAQFAVVKNMDLSTADGQSQAVQRYLNEMVVPKNTASLTSLPDVSPALGKVLVHLSQPLAGENGFFAGKLQQDIATNGLAGAFTRLQDAFRTGNAENMNVLSGVQAELLAEMPNHPRAGDLVAALREAMPTLGVDKMAGLAMTLHMSDAPLGTAADRQTAIRQFMIQDATRNPGVQQALDLAGLPRNFASAIGNNPAVTRHIAALLHDNPGPGVLPSMERAGEVMDIAVQVFVEDNLPLLREFAIMANDAPGKLNPPVTAETMPRYINAMIAGDALLGTLLNADAPIDKAFLNQLAEHAEALNSATHSFRGDYGADDVAAVLRNSVAMLLARRGVSQEMLPGLVTEATKKFGTVASNFATLNHAVQRGLGGGNFRFLQESMTLFRSLEGHGRVLMNLLTREQQVELGVAVPGAVDVNSDAVQRQDGSLRTDFVEKYFEEQGDIEQLPVMIREFAREHGLNIPRLSQTQQKALGDENREVVTSVIDELIPEHNHVVESNSQAFRTLFADMNQNGALEGLNPDHINPRSFTVAVRHALFQVQTEASQAGQKVDAATLRQHAETALREGLLSLKQTVDALGNLPADQFSEAEKTSMKTLAQRYGVRDADAIKTVFLAQKEVGNSRELGIARLSDTPGVFTRKLVDLAQGFCAFHQRFTDLPGSEDLLPMFCDFILEGMPPAEIAHVAANIDSDTAHKLAGTCMHIINNNDNMDTTQIMALLQIMTHLHQNAELRLGHDPVVQPMYFMGDAVHFCELPGDTDAALDRLSRLAPGAITAFDIQMNRHESHLTPQQWEALRGIHQNLYATAGDQGFLLSYWVETSAHDLLAALDANHGKPLSNKQIWEAMIGGSMPRNVRTEHFGEDMLRITSQRYQKLLQAAAPDMPEALSATALMNSSTLGLSPKKLLELTRPHASLSMADLSVPLSMGSLRGIDPSTAYGLETDFRRRGTNTQMSFTTHNGATLATHPFAIPDDENNPQHPHFNEILNHVQMMTHSEPQLARTMQCFSQAALIMPRVLSTCFPGLQLSEHGNFSVNAQEQADGSIIVNITSDPGLPLRLEEQIRVNTDGSHTFERLDMHRL